MAAPLPDVFRTNVRRRLSELGWRQNQLAEALGISEAAVSQLLNSEKSPTLRAVETTAKALDCSGLYLLTSVAADKPEKISA